GQGEMDEVILPPVDFPVPGELEESRPAPKVTHKRTKTVSGRRREQAESGHGRYVGIIPAVSGARRRMRIAIDATLRAAAPRQRQRRGVLESSLAEINNAEPREQAGSTTKNAKHESKTKRVIVRPRDLKFKRLKHRTGVLFIFLVDTSGSMALGRIGHAKGVMIRMLRQAYMHRDRVSLLAFRGTSVEVALEPTASVELARRAIESMPAGGGTPLGAGLA